MAVSVKEADQLMQKYESEVESMLQQRDLARMMGTDILDPVQQEVNMLSERLLALTKLPEITVKRAENEVRDSKRRMKAIVKNVEKYYVPQRMDLACADSPIAGTGDDQAVGVTEETVSYGV